MNVPKTNDLLFARKYKVWRHLVFWATHTVVIAFVWHSLGRTMERNILQGSFWIPVRMLYCYPLIYWVLPRYLLKGRYVAFSFIIVLWGLGGYFLNYSFRAFIFIPLEEALRFNPIERNPWSPTSFLVLTTTAGTVCFIFLFKHWLLKQQQWLQAEKEKVTAELQLLKAQVHPHFLFNTLNNIYSFALGQSLKTPGMILQLSSLLSYMLYDCKADEVLLEKEIEVMKDYIELEQARYGDNIEISQNFEGDIKDKYIAPLLLLPFLENAFKHGTSDQLERPWLSMDIAVKQYTLHCKIANSKNNHVPLSASGIGIENVRKRLQFIYPNRHELKISDEGDFFVVSLRLELKNYGMKYRVTSSAEAPSAQNVLS
jgi:two-component system, LytTR family, sensor histidine kinase AlgZ